MRPPATTPTTSSTRCPTRPDPRSIDAREAGPVQTGPASSCASSMIGSDDGALAPGEDLERNRERRDERRDHVRRGVAVEVGGPAQGRLEHDAAGGAHQVVEREHSRPLLGRDDAVHERLPERPDDREDQGPDGHQDERRPEDGVSPTKSSTPTFRTPPRMIASVRRRNSRRTRGHEQPADDLGAGDDRRGEAGDAVRGRVAVQLEQIRLERVERVDARRRAVNGAASISQRTGGLRQPPSIEPRTTERIAATGLTPRRGVKPRSCMKKKAITNVDAEDRRPDDVGHAEVRDLGDHPAAHGADEHRRPADGLRSPEHLVEIALVNRSRGARRRAMPPSPRRRT